MESESMGRNRISVTTTVNSELRKLAHERSIKLSDALDVGIKELAGHSGEDESIQERTNSLKKEEINLKDELDNTQTIDLDTVLDKYKRVVEMGNLIHSSSIEYYAPKLGLSINNLEEIVRNKFGDVIENVHIAKRGEIIEGLDL